MVYNAFCIAFAHTLIHSLYSEVKEAEEEAFHSIWTFGTHCIATIVWRACGIWKTVTVIIAMNVPLPFPFTFLPVTRKLIWYGRKCLLLFVFLLYVHIHFVCIVSRKTSLKLYLLEVVLAVAAAVWWIVLQRHLSWVLLWCRLARNRNRYTLHILR